MHSLGELKAQLEDERPVSWQQMPDIALYMNQIVSYMPRQLIGFSADDKLTPAMVNNYIKDGLLPRADGKKYSKEHIAYLTAICMLKQVISVRDIRTLLQDAMGRQEIDGFYAGLTGLLDTELNAVTAKLDDHLEDDDLGGLALALGVSAYCQQLLCKRLIHAMADRQGGETAERETKKKKKETKD